MSAQDDIVSKLDDLLKQATTERSHYYVASCCRQAIAEIKRLRTYLGHAMEMVTPDEDCAECDEIRKFLESR